MRTVEIRTMTPPRRILAARGGALGDFILSFPSLDALRHAWPDAEIRLLASPAHAALATAWNLADSSRDPNSSTSSALFSANLSLDPAWQSWIADCDLVVSWLPDPDRAFQQRCRSLGIRSFHQGPHSLTSPLPAWQQLAAALPDGLSALPFHRPHSPSSNTLAIHPGSGGRSKIWPLANWHHTILQLAASHRFSSFLIVTGECELDSPAADLANFLRNSGIDAEPAHNLPLTALADRLSTCTAFAGHDSGVSHLAAACGLPCALLFGPTNPAVWAPPHARTLVAPHGDLAALPTDAVIPFIANTPTTSA